MKKFLVVLFVLLIATPVFAQEKRTRQYEPIIRQADYTTVQTNATIWTPTTYAHIVMDSYTVSSNSDQLVTLAASDTIVKLHCTASQPVVSPGGFLWSEQGETIRVTTQLGNVSITLTGWEEDR